MDVSGQFHVRAALFLRYPLNRTVAGRRTLVGSLKKVGGKLPVRRTGWRFLVRTGNSLATISAELMWLLVITMR